MAPTPILNRFLRAATSTTLLLSLLRPGLLPAADHEGGLWATANLGLKLRPDLTAGLIVEPRFDQDVDRLERLLFRPSVTRRIGRTSLTFGYDAHLIQEPRDRIEHRLWQQVERAGASDYWRPSYRLRLEERHFDDIGGVIFTTRWKAQVKPALGTDGAYWRAGAEVFFNFNEQSVGPREGYDQTRLQLAVGRPVGGAAVEVGYQLQHLDLRGTDRVIHQALAAVILRF